MLGFSFFLDHPIVIALEAMKILRGLFKLFFKTESDSAKIGEFLNDCSSQVPCKILFFFVPLLSFLFFRSLFLLICAGGFPYLFPSLSLSDQH